jgi:ankyrin repeat protein
MEHIAIDTGSTALHEVARHGDMEVLDILLKAGANPGVKNDMGKAYSYYLL